MKQYKIDKALPKTINIDKFADRENLLTKSPREETFLEMIATSVCPLLKVNHWKSFTFFICSFDILYYIVILIVQALMRYRNDKPLQYSPLRPSQTGLFYFGQLYPYYVTKEFECYRLILGIEMFKNEIQLFITVIFKLHFFSYVENFLETKKTIILYLICGISSSVFQSIYNSQPGVCGSFPIGVILFAFILQQRQIRISSPSEQLHYYHDYQQSQDFYTILIKTSIVLLIFSVLSLKDTGIMFAGTFVFMLQSVFIGRAFLQKSAQLRERQVCIIQYQTQPQKKIQDVPETERKQFPEMFWLLLSIIILIILIVVMFIQKETTLF